MCRVGENIHKRKDGRWEGRFQLTTSSGEKKLKSVYGKTYREVKEKLQTIRTVDENNDCSFTKHFFCEVADEWLLLQSTEHKGATFLKYKTIVEGHLNPEFAKLNISTITEPMITQFISNKQATGNLKTKGPLSNSYVKLLLVVLIAILDYAAGMNYRSELKSVYITKPAVPKTEVQCLDINSQKILDTHIKFNINENTTGVSLGLYAGLRIGEVCALKWDDIDFNNNVIFVRQTVARVKNNEHSKTKTKLIIDVPKTETSKRTVPINSRLRQILMAMYEQSHSDYVISTKQSFVSPRTFEYHFHKILEICNIEKINFHVLRHTFATRCMEVGVDIKTLSELLGHASVDITLNTYVHSSLERKRSEIEKLSSLCG
jgi:integrase